MVTLEQLKDPKYRLALVNAAIFDTLEMLKRIDGKALPAGEARDITSTLDTLLNGYLDEFIGNGGKEPALRQVHAKGHGAVLAQFEVLSSVPQKLRHGMFAQPGIYPAWVRFSNGAQTVQSDLKGDIRAFSIKVLGVPGAKVLDAAGARLQDSDHSQDFLASNGKGFFVRRIADYPGFVAALSTKNPILRLARLAWHFKFRWLEAGNLAGPARRSVESLQTEQYWSQVPYRLGPEYIKFSLEPRLKAGDSKGDSPDYLRKRLAAALAQEEIVFDFTVQRRACPDHMPIDDAAVIWEESHQPFEKVAVVRLLRQDIGLREGDNSSSARDTLVENMRFFPWHCGVEHAPVGTIGAGRLAIYSGMSRLRRDINGVLEQPKPDLLKIWHEEYAKLPK